MSEQDELRRFLPDLPLSLVLITAVVGGAIWFQDPYQSQRPPPKGDPVSDETVGEAPVVARLWQDPFVVVEQYAERASEVDPAGRVFDPHSLSTLRDEIELRLREYEAERDPEAWTLDRVELDPSAPRGDGPEARVFDPALLPVLVPGSHWPVDAESRRRTRRAVLSGVPLTETLTASHL